jgi:hypothetical protein
VRIVAWKHKHGVNYYDASTDEALQASARKIIKDLLTMGYIYEPEHPMMHIQYSGIDLEQAQLTDEQIDVLPTLSLRAEATKHKDALTRRYREYEEAKKEYADYQRCAAGEPVMQAAWRRKADSPDGKYKAGDMMPESEVPPWKVLQWRDGGEYEDFSLETVWTPDNERLV